MAGARRRVPPVAVLAALALLAGCSRAVMTTPSVPPTAGMEEVGMASWYGAPHHGHRTASGEVFDMYQLTAAHKTLPFGTRLLVTNRDTSQSTEVRVNDRGPFVEGRILDVSYAAARLLGAVGPGIIPVRMRVLSLPARSSSGDGPSDHRSTAFEGGEMMRCTSMASVMFFSRSCPTSSTR
jgi:rare lipoprotein A (peptidoglycan hydrolase)